MFNMYNRRYTGSKYKLMEWIKTLITDNCDGKTFFDVFAGTGVVTEYMINDYEKYIINDFLYSNEVIYKGFLLQENYDMDKLTKVVEIYNETNKTKLQDNYVSINFGGRYFNKEDAKLIGKIREDLETSISKKEINSKEYYILIASLLFSIDKIANTCGHYDAYRKIDNIESKFKYELILPKQLKEKQEIEIYREDSNSLAKKIKADIAFIDPPYNSRQYSRFYHVLENITKWEKTELYGIALKPKEENMSEYCKTSAPKAFKDLIDSLNVKYAVVTYNNTYNSKSSSSKNKITLEEIKSILDEKGETKVFDKPYKFFNAGKTELKNHKEYLFITKVEK
ncbi:MAG: adenine methyltransferase [Clostridia bacterium]|jgi:adenine-specific DNA-methyltransferase|nr:adenine methyltransferase [Clostridia bacterium]